MTRILRTLTEISSLPMPSRNRVVVLAPSIVKIDPNNIAQPQEKPVHKTSREYVERGQDPQWWWSGALQEKAYVEETDGFIEAVRKGSALPIYEGPLAGIVQTDELLQEAKDLVESVLTSPRTRAIVADIALGNELVTYGLEIAGRERKPVLALLSHAEPGNHGQINLARNAGAKIDAYKNNKQVEAKTRRFTHDRNLYEVLL